MIWIARAHLGECARRVESSGINLNLSSVVLLENRTAERECLNESFPSVVGITSLMLTDGRGACPSHVNCHWTHTLSLSSLVLTLLRQAEGWVQRTFVLTSTSTCVRISVHGTRVRRRTTETVSRNPGPARRRNLDFEAERYSTKVRVSTSRIYVEGGGK